MKILITGANGYIGSSLNKSLKDKYEVTCVTRSDFDVTVAQSVFEFFKDKYFDVVIHCAIAGGSRLKEDDWKVFDLNMQAYYNLLQCRSSYGRFINFGSGAEHYQWNLPYGFSKRAISNSIKHNDDFYNIRIYAVFDENELKTRFIKANILRHIERVPMQIYQNKVMDFFYMKDLIKVVNYYITKEEPEKEFDCSYDESYSFFEIAQLINKIGGYDVEIQIPNSSEIDHYASLLCTKNKIGLEFIGLEEGIRLTYQKIKDAK